jgi:hypothetical protein
MEQRDPTTFLLICWLFFLGCVTWFDSSGFALMLVLDHLGLVASHFLYVGMASLVFWQVATAITTRHYSRLQRSVLILSFVWLLVRPLIPWHTEKSLLIRSALLVPGMTKAQVQARMTAFPGVQDLNGTGEDFCTVRAVQGSQCKEEAILVHMKMSNNRLEDIKLDIDL